MTNHTGSCIVSRTGTMEIRRATPDDAHSIAVIHVVSSRATYRGLLPDAFLDTFTVERREAGWRQSLEAKDSEVWIAEDAGRAVGWLCAGSSRDPGASKGTAEVWAMYVDPQWWRRGIGRALWAYAEAHLRSAGFSDVTLWVHAGNDGATAFYGSIGFVEDPGGRRIRERAGAELVDIRLRHRFGG